MYVNKALGQGTGNESSCSRNAVRKRGLGERKKRDGAGVHGAVPARCKEENNEAASSANMRAWGEEGARVICWLCAARAAASPRAEARVVCEGPALCC